jgi:uncharacterized damage-inducible protein DinB
MDLDTIRILFTYQDWTRDRLMAVVEPLSDGQLDRAFEMGPGSLRETVGHLYASEWLWLARWKGRPPVRSDVPSEFASMTALRKAWRLTADERNAFLDTLADTDLDRSITSTGMDGNERTFTLGQMMLHACNHGTHHRAQALNMLRHVGVNPPPLDFTIMFDE